MLVVCLIELILDGDRTVAVRADAFELEVTLLVPRRDEEELARTEDANERGAVSRSADYEVTSLASSLQASRGGHARGG